jgi:hypothetical protein
MGQIVAMRFSGQTDASVAMLRLRRCTPPALGVQTALSISFDKTQKATVEQLVDPLDIEDYRWSLFWVGLLYAGQADFLAENLPLEVMHQIPLLFLDRAWWTEEITIPSDFLNDIQVLLHSKDASVLMALRESSDIPLMCAEAPYPDTTVCRNLTAEQMRAIHKIIYRETTSTVSCPSQGKEE